MASDALLTTDSPHCKCPVLRLHRLLLIIIVIMLMLRARHHLWSTTSPSNCHRHRHSSIHTLSPWWGTLQRLLWAVSFMTITSAVYQSTHHKDLHSTMVHHFIHRTLR